MCAGGEAEPTAPVVDSGRYADVDATHRIDDTREAEHVDLDVVVDRQPGVVLDRVDGELRPTEGVRRVELVVLRAVLHMSPVGVRRYLDVGVAGEADQHRL